MVSVTSENKKRGRRQLPWVLRSCAADRREWSASGAAPHLDIPAPRPNGPLRLVGVRVAGVVCDVCRERRLDFCASRRGGFAHYIWKIEKSRRNETC